MDAFEMTPLLKKHALSGRLYLEFLCVASLSMGVYRLPAGGVDPQSPHSEDEVYYVVDGKAQIRVGADESDEDRWVGAGSIVFVAANVPHRFQMIEEDLTVLVFFAPAEYSLRSQSS
jgi:mannose-6-phosphate isomerase-like protein (cupin superfamily)